MSPVQFILVIYTGYPEILCQTWWARNLVISRTIFPEHLIARQFFRAAVEFFMLKNISLIKGSF